MSYVWTLLMLEQDIPVSNETKLHPDMTEKLLSVILGN